MNRETKRMLQRSGSIDEAGNPVRAPRTPPTAAERPPRVPPTQYLREVQGELKKVAWPTRPEIKNYTIVVIVTLIIMTILTFAYDWAFAKGVLYLLDR